MVNGLGNKEGLALKIRKLGAILVMILLVSLLLSGCLGGGSSYTVSGTVVEDETEVPLCGAVVQIGTKRVTTNALGQYELKKVPTGIATLSITLDGYETHTEQVAINQDDTIKVVLKTGASPLDASTLQFAYRDYITSDPHLVDDGDELEASAMMVSGKSLLAQMSSVFVN